MENLNIHSIKKNNITRRIHPNIIKEINNKFQNSGLIGFEEHHTTRDSSEKSDFEELYLSENEFNDDLINLILSQLKKGKKYKDICILSRNNFLLNDLEKRIKHLELTKGLKLPTKKDNGGMSESVEVKVINNILLSILLPLNKLYIKKVLDNFIGDKEEIFRYYQKNESTQEIKDIEEKIQKIREKRLTIEEILYLIVKEFNLYVVMFKIRGKNSISVMNRYIEYLFNLIPYLKNKNEFVNRIEYFHLNKSLTLDLNEEIDAVHLLTIHKSKGLEFDTVILLEQDIFREMSNGVKILTNGNIIDLGKNKIDKPFGYKEFDLKYNKYIEEEKQSQMRLYYVALTRSKNNLFIVKS